MAADHRGVALVTGASRGIGRILALHLARVGWHVVAVARPSADLGDRGAANVSAFAAAKAGVARLTETLAKELHDTGVTVIGMHPGFVRTPMTERMAWGEDGRRWLPGFADGAERSWGDGRGAAQLLHQIASGAADGLSGRIVYVGDDLAALGARSSTDDDARRLRIRP